MTPVDPAAIAAELDAIETDINEAFGRRPDAMPTQRKLIATCRALLAELAQSRAAVEVAEAVDRFHNASVSSPSEAVAIRDTKDALAQYRAAKAGAGTQGQEQRT